MSVVAADLPLAPASKQAQSRLMVARHVERSARLFAFVWGLVFGLFVLATVRSFVTLYPTVTSRLKLTSSLQAFSALLGPPYHAETVAGFTSWRVLTVITIIGAIWGLRTSTGLLRGQEDLGQWELLLAGPKTKRGAAGEALLGLALAAAELFAVTAVLTLAAGTLPGAHFGTGPSLLFAAALVTGAVMFLAIGSLTSQLSATRGQASSLAVAVLIVSFLVRLVADSRTDLGWLRWLSPVGWIENLRPLRGTQPLALVPIVATVVLCVVLSLLLAGRRDLQAGMLRENGGRAGRGIWPAGPTGLAMRLSRAAVLGWLGGLAVMSGVYGLLTRSSATLLASSPQIAAALARFGAHRASESFLGAMFLMYSVLVGVVAASQVAAIRDEEASGRLDNLLARPVRRITWLAGRAGLSLLLVVLAGVVSGVFSWVGAASQHSGVALSKLLEAGLNTLAPGIFVLGAGLLVYGLLPRFAAVAAYGIVSWSFLAELVGSLSKGASWLRDSSLFAHIALAPAAQPDWGSAAAIIALGAAAAGVGAATFVVRDLEYA